VSVLILATLTDRIATRTIYLAPAVWAGVAGTYVPGMRLAAERFGPECRGLAIAC